MQIDKDKIKEFLDNAVRQIQTEEDPKELNQYRKIFRENVSFSLRSYFAAYMVKAALEGGSQGRRNSTPKERYSYPERNTDKRGRQGEAAAHHGAHTPIPVLSEDEASSVFIGIGRKRKVFPKDIIYLIIQHSGIERAHIGEIKILDNYSFAQILTSDAQKVIDSLSGIEYRGKKLTVSFARKADGYDADSLQAGNDLASETAQGEDSDAQEDIPDRIGS